MKKNIYIICLIGALLTVSFIAGFFVTKSLAVVPAPLGFGGHLTKVAYCGCSESWWLEYAPIKDSSFPGGALNYSDFDTITYSYYEVFTPGVWHLGTYLPGVQRCWIYVGVSCSVLPTLGEEVMVGTSLTPSPL